MSVFENYIYSRLERAHHDDGFRMSLLVVALYKLCPEESTKRLALRAIDELAKGYVLVVGVLPGFFGHCGEDRVQTIVDDMMNIAIWMWAGEETKNTFYKECPVRGKMGGQAGYEITGCVWEDYFMVEALMRKLHGNNMPDFWV